MLIKEKVAEILLSIQFGVWNNQSEQESFFRKDAAFVRTSMSAPRLAHEDPPGKFPGDMHTGIKENILLEGVMFMLSFVF